MRATLRCHHLHHIPPLAPASLPPCPRPPAPAADQMFLALWGILTFSESSARRTAGASAPRNRQQRLRYVHSSQHGGAAHLAACSNRFQATRSPPFPHRGPLLTVCLCRTRHTLPATPPSFPQSS